MLRDGGIARLLCAWPSQPAEVGGREGAEGQTSVTRMPEAPCPILPGLRTGLTLIVLPPRRDAKKAKGGEVPEQEVKIEEYL